MSESALKAPFPYFGGKRKAAPLIWEALGDVGGYTEPFAGSAAVLLARPAWKGRRVETINDFDGWVTNAWRAIKLDPAAVAYHASGPVTEIDLHARLAWLQERRGEELRMWLEGDPEHFDAKHAGWWLYVMSCGLGKMWEPGPWRQVDGVMVNAGKGVKRTVPHLGDAGKGVQEAFLYQEMSRLAARLEDVRITSGDWHRVLTPSATRAKTGGNGHYGIFLDPPYSTGSEVYGASDADSVTISDHVREWCKTQHGKRIVLAGFLDDHDELLDHGWTKTKGISGGANGYNRSTANAGARERLWMSPECNTLTPESDTLPLFGDPA